MKLVCCALHNLILEQDAVGYNIDEYYWNEPEIDGSDADDESEESDRGSQRQARGRNTNLKVFNKWKKTDEYKEWKERVARRENERKNRAGYLARRNRNQNQMEI